ncbi:MAG: hypothetical protein INQ03_14795 [Candidatus Heimdallarchaeota archaeon]|nr:hypothetical protein [Candidatus Heimdallarchaeota archaeon]
MFKSKKTISHFSALENEQLLEEVVTRVWNFRPSWLPLLIIVFAGMLTAVLGTWFIPIQLVIILLTLWGSTYLIRERWRLSLTDKQIVARQLYPRPFTFITQDHHFPINQIEGLTTGPRTFRSILLVGIFLSTNLGINLLQSGLTQEGDLPPTVDAFLEIIRGIDFLPIDLDGLADSLESFGLSFLNLLGDAQVILGIIFVIFGLIMVLSTLPRREHIQIRVRHGKDFKLNAGIPSSFWHKCYNEIYHEKVTEAPKEYKNLKFQWFDGEEIQTNADLEQTVHYNRVFSLFIIYAGARRLIERIFIAEVFVDDTFIWWIIVTLVDIFLAATALNFAKKKNELIITSKRILFIREEKDISGTFGRRLYQISDIRRDDVAGFNFKKIRAFSFAYLILGSLLLVIMIIFRSQISVLDTLLLGLSVLVSYSFVNQTYVQFDLLTKGGEIWHMRHQLSNPATIMRELMGGEDNSVITAIFANRLEESEIIDIVQTVREGDIGLEHKFKDKQIMGAKVNIKDLMLKGEKVVLETNVSRKVPRRKLTLSVASLILMMWMPISIALTLAMAEEYALLASHEIFFGALAFAAGLFSLLMIIMIWVKFYSFFKASLIITEKRVFFRDKKVPPLILYLLGVHNELIINESMRSQVHSTYTNRQFAQKAAMLAFIRHSYSWLGWLIVFGILQAIYLSMLEAMENYQNEIVNYANVEVEILFVGVQFISVLILLSGLKVAWHASNGFIELIRGWPKRIFNARGVGMHFTVPFLKKEKAGSVNYAMWTGKVREES